MVKSAQSGEEVTQHYVENMFRSSDIASSKNISQKDLQEHHPRLVPRMTYKPFAQ